MFNQKAGLSLQCTFSALLFWLLQIHLCRGQSQVVGPSQPIVATLGDDIILPCYLEPAYDATTLMVEWARPDLNPRFIYVLRGGQDLEHMKNPSFKGRTSMFIDELKHGNISLKISKVKPADAGRYRCFTPVTQKDTFMELVVGAVSQPVTTLAGVDGKGGVELQCESAGWYPEPEVLWLDADGNLLSAGPTETVRGPDDLYTVSSRVTVEKKHGNKFTCRVHQKNINQSRETWIHVLDDFFITQSCNTSPTVGLAVCLVIAIILLVVLFVHTQRQKRKRKTSENGKQEELQQLKGNHSETNKQLQQKRKKNKLLNSRLGKLLDRNKMAMESVGEPSTELDKINKEEEVSETNLDCGKSMPGPIALEEVHKEGHYVRLKNISSEEIKLEGWKLKLQINNSEPVIYTFKESLKLQAGSILYISHQRYSSSTPPGDVKLVWFDMMRLSSTDKLQINIINNNGEIYRLL